MQKTAASCMRAHTHSYRHTNTLPRTMSHDHQHLVLQLFVLILTTLQPPLPHNWPPATLPSPGTRVPWPGQRPPCLSFSFLSAYFVLFLPVLCSFSSLLLTFLSLFFSLLCFASSTQGGGLRTPAGSLAGRQTSASTANLGSLSG